MFRFIKFRNHKIHSRHDVSPSEFILELFIDVTFVLNILTLETYPRRNGIF